MRQPELDRDDPGGLASIESKTPKSQGFVEPASASSSVPSRRRTALLRLSGLLGFVGIAIVLSRVLVAAVGAFGSNGMGLRAVQPVLEWKSSDLPFNREPPVANLVFRLVNDGSRPIRVQSVQASCGCTKLALSAEDVPPRSEVELTATVTTFPFGEKSISVEVHTDAEPDRPLGLTILMHGTRKPPYLLQWHGDLTYLSASQFNESRLISVIALEKSGGSLPPIVEPSAPWVKLGSPRVVDKPDVTAGYKVRTYFFPVTVAPIGEGSVATASVSVKDPYQPDHVGTIPVEVRPSSGPTVFPSRLRWDVERLEAKFSSRVLLRWPAPVSDIEVSILPKSAIGTIEVRRLEADGVRSELVEFEIRPKPGALPPQGDYVVLFSTSGNPRRSARCGITVRRGDSK